MSNLTADVISIVKSLSGGDYEMAGKMYLAQPLPKRKQIKCEVACLLNENDREFWDLIADDLQDTEYICPILGDPSQLSSNVNDCLLLLDSPDYWGYFQKTTTIYYPDELHHNTP